MFKNCSFLSFSKAHFVSVPFYFLTWYVCRQYCDRCWVFNGNIRWEVPQNSESGLEKNVCLYVCNRCFDTRLAQNLLKRSYSNFHKTCNLGRNRCAKIHFERFKKTNPNFWKLPKISTFSISYSVFINRKYWAVGSIWGNKY